MKATPGPWETWGGELNVRDIKNHNFVASCGANGYDNEESRANAHLIATAPELLEACKVILEQFRNQEGELVHGHCSANFSHMEGQCNCGLTKLQQAIAKAEGAK